MSNAPTGQYEDLCAKAEANSSRILAVVLLALVAFFVSTVATAQTYPTAPAVPLSEQICSNPAISATPSYPQGILINPNKTVPSASNPLIVNGVPQVPGQGPLVTIVPAGDNSGGYGTSNYYAFTTPNMTFYFMPGVHYVGQIIPGANSTFIGVPPDYVGAPTGLGPAVITGISPDGSTIQSNAFSGYTQPRPTGITIEYLTIENFGAAPAYSTVGYNHVTGGNQSAFVVNQDANDNWTVKYNTIQSNHGAGVNSGSNGVISYNCIKANGQYGISLYSGDAYNGQLSTFPVTNWNGANSSTPLKLSINNVTIDHNEIVGNDSDDWETLEPGCGCSGGAKFWNSSNLMVTNNYVHDNLNVGLWADTDNADITFNNNYFDHNFAEAIEYEISYNATITNNIFTRNAIGAGLEFELGRPADSRVYFGGSTPSNFPISAIYISESGYDSRVDPFQNTIFGPTMNITGNTFINNWGGVTLWENPGRFCGDSAFSNGGSADGYYCTLVPTSTMTFYSGWYPEPAGDTNLWPTEPPPSDPECRNNLALYPTDCRWKTQNVLVSNNTFSFDPASVGAIAPVPGGSFLTPLPTGPCNTTYCGHSGLFSSTFGQIPPYTGTTIEDAITYNQGDQFTGNTYYGPWSFAAHDQGYYVGFATWQGTPTSRNASNTGGFGQDATSTLTSTTPVITALSAASGSVGTQVVITGIGLGSPGAVTIGGAAATVASGGWSATSVTTTVPGLATSGVVQVTPAGATVPSNALSFTVPIVINQVTGTVGGSVTITGTGFGTGGTLSFNGLAPALVTSWTTSSTTGAGQIQATMPSTITSGPVTIALIINGVTATYIFNPSSTTPSISLPISGASGTLVTITYKNIGTATGGTVNFGGATITPNPTWNISGTTATFQVTVPSFLTGSTQTVSVTPNAGSSPAPASFIVTSTVPPSISLSPSSGTGGSSVVISATGSTNLGVGGTVSFGGTSASAMWNVSGNTSTITATVPTAAGSYVAVVTPTNGVASSSTGTTANTFTVTSPPPTGTNYIDSNTAYLNGTSFGAWGPWYGTPTFSLSTTEPAGGPGGGSLMISGTSGNWGLQTPYGGFTVPSVPLTISFWAVANQTIPNPMVMTVRWVTGSGAVNGTTAVTLPSLSTTWAQSPPVTLTPPAGTATMWVTLEGNSPAGSIIDADSFSVSSGSAPVAPSISNVLTTASPQIASGPVGTPITITGANFGTSPGTVSFGTLSVTPTASNWSARTITTTIPSSGVSTGPVNITVTTAAALGALTSPGNNSFTVTSPPPPPTGTNYIDSNTAYLNGTSFGAWGPWYGTPTFSLSTTEPAGGPGGGSLMISGTSGNWGLQTPYGGFTVPSVPLTISFWAVANQTIPNPMVMTVRWVTGSGAVNGTTAVTLPSLSTTWAQSPPVMLTPPAGTATMWVTLEGNSPAGSIIYADSFSVSH